MNWNLHISEDEKWAKWLQKKLESYGFPVALRKDNPSLLSKIRPIFRDQSELSGGNLKEEIEKGLKESKKAYLKDLYEKGHTSDKKHRYQPQIISRYQKRIEQLQAAPNPE